MSEFADLLIATHNPGKAREIKDLLKDHVENFFTAADFDLDEPVEDGESFEENALIKARAAAKASGKLSLADDSGLCVTALDHQPGIYSARWGGPEKDFGLAMQRVQDELGPVEDRSAYFVCVLALAWPDGTEETYRGEVHGVIAVAPKGEKGFGYDPIFVPNDYDMTFAEMEPSDKHAISHRAQAFAKMIDSIANQQKTTQNNAA